MDWNKKLCTWDQQIRDGKLSDNKRELLEINSASVPDRHRKDVSQLLRRLGHAQKGLMILTPLVLDSDSKINSGLDPGVLIEYSAQLRMVGLTGEALDLLRSLDPSGFPEVHLIKTFCYFSYWDYDRAEQELRDYLKHSELEPYQQAVGCVNLLASLVQQRKYDKSQKLALDLLNRFAENDYTRLQANVYELQTQSFIMQGNDAMALETLNKSRSLLTENTSLDSVFIDKWAAYLDAKESRSILPLKKFEAFVRPRGHWETLRQLDFLQLTIEFDEMRYRQLYFGSPNEKYRQILVKEFGVKLQEESLDFGDSSGPVIDVFEGKVLPDQDLDKPGSVLHRFLWSVYFDLYKPRLTPQLFSMIYPDEVFNIFSSPNRVHKVASRIKKKLEKNGLPHLFISGEDGYHPKLPLDFQIRMRREKQMPTDLSLKIVTLQQQTSAIFSRKEISRLLGLSSAGTTRFLREAVQKNRLFKQKDGKKILYKTSA